MFYKRKIYKLEQSKENIRTMNIYLIQETLPSFIPWDDSFMEAGNKFAIGEGYTARVIWDTTALPHGLIAGATGSGKTGILRCLIHQAIYKKWNIQVLDFKGGGDYASVEREAQKYRDLENGYGPFIIFELALCNDWEWFVTLTLNPEYHDRKDLKSYKKKLLTWIKNYNRTQKTNIKYLLIPENHQDGSWHMHGLMMGIPEEHLREFTEQSGCQSSQEWLYEVVLRALREGTP